MRTVRPLMLMMSVFACPYVATHLQALQTDRPSPAADRVDVYEVPLMCPAARGLGCGSRAKPVLLALQDHAAVEEAWLDRAGRRLAVVWKPGITRAAREAAITAVSEAHQVAITEMDAHDRAQVVESFRVGAGWHRGVDVDRLSEEEAGVIAERLWTRLVAKAPTATQKRDALMSRLTEAIRQCLLTSSVNCEETFRAKLLAAIRAQLDEAEVRALTDAIKAGCLPLVGEP